MFISKRLLRLSLFQCGLGFSAAVFTGTFNRVLITEEGIPASVVGWLLSLSLFVAPIRVLLGAKSDGGKGKFGYRRFPYVYYGIMLVFAGLSAAPFSLLFLSKSSSIGQGTTPFAIGVAFSTMVFLLYAVGVHVAQTGYLALVADIVPKKDRHNAVAFLWCMLIVGQIVSSLVISGWLRDYQPIKMLQVVQTASLVFVALAMLAVLKQERAGIIEGEESTSLSHIRQILATPRNRLFFIIVFLGTFAITGQDVLLEPYGGQVLNMHVNETSLLTALLGAGVLLAMLTAIRTHTKFPTPLHMGVLGAVVGAIGFCIIILTSINRSVPMFAFGGVVIGYAHGLFLIATLSIIMTLADSRTAGLFVGLWGLVQTSATGIGTLIGGVTRDVAMHASDSTAVGYVTFYGVELACALATAGLLIVMLRAKDTSDLLNLRPNRPVFGGLTDIPGG